MSMQSFQNALLSYLLRMETFLVKRERIFCEPNFTDTALDVPVNMNSGMGLWKYIFNDQMRPLMWMLLTNCYPASWRRRSITCSTCTETVATWQWFDVVLLCLTSSSEVHENVVKRKFRFSNFNHFFRGTLRFCRSESKTPWYSSLWKTFWWWTNELLVNGMSQISHFTLPMTWTFLWRSVKTWKKGSEEITPPIESLHSHIAFTEMGGIFKWKFANRTHWPPFAVPTAIVNL